MFWTYQTVLAVLIFAFTRLVIYIHITDVYFSENDGDENDWHKIKRVEKKIWKDFFTNFSLPVKMLLTMGAFFSHIVLYSFTG